MLSEVMDKIKHIIGGFRPQGRKQVEDFFLGMPDVIETLSSSLVQAAGNMEHDGHVHPAVINATAELADSVSSAVHNADQVYAEHLRAHSIWVVG